MVKSTHHTSLRLAVPLLVAALLGIARAPAVTSQTVLVGFEAVVGYIFDPAGYIPWYIIEEDMWYGDTLRGYYVYELGVLDGNPSPNIGTYEYSQPPFHIAVFIGSSWSVRTDSLAVDGIISVLDSLVTPSETYDRLRISSRSNVGDLPLIWQIVLEFTDPTLSALSSDTLVLGTPELNVWQEKVLWLYGDGFEWVIGAELVSVSETLPTSIDSPPPLSGSLGQARPNPFNPATTIPLQIERGSEVRLSVATIRGEVVRTIYAGRLEAGAHEFMWDGRDDRGRNLASGLYLVTLEMNGRRSVAKATLLK